MRSRQLVTLATASSGIATSILLEGRTEHSRFKITFNLDKISTCNVSKQSLLETLLRVARLIVWNEAPMLSKHIVEVFDRMLCDINESYLLFGGKFVVFSNNFCQVLLLVCRGTREQQIDASLLSSYMRPTLTKIRLAKNMLARLDPNCSQFLH